MDTLDETLKRIDDFRKTLQASGNVWLAGGRGILLQSLQNRVTEVVVSVDLNQAHFGVLSIGEQIAVALVLDRLDLFRTIHPELTVLEAVTRIGHDWVEAAVAVQRTRLYPWR